MARLTPTSHWIEESLHLLAWPYTDFERWPEQPPVAAILVADLRQGIAPLANALLVHRRTPWCPMCLISDGSLTAEELAAFGPWLAHVPAPGPRSQFAVSPAAVVRAVNGRPRPRPADIAAYAASRTESAGLAKLLEAHVFHSSSPLSASPRTFTRRLAGLGRLLPHEWLRVHDLVGWLQEPTEDPYSLERKAARLGVDRRTLRRWLSRLVGVSLSEAAQRPGWEWIVEATLRRFGYLNKEGANQVPNVARGG